MEKMTPDLLRTYWARTVSPVIVEARVGAFDRVRAQLKATVPLDMLQTKFGPLPRLTGQVEIPFSKWKEIPTFNMVAAVLTPGLIEEVAQWGDVEKVYPDYTKYALQVVPDQGIYKGYKGVTFTSTHWTKQLMGLDRANEKGFTGRDILAVTIDTGARNTHEQLGRVRILTAAPEKGFSGWDQNGHGTWVSSCLGGARGFDRRYNVPVEGMAPHCDLTSIQALGFIIGAGSSSDIISAMETCIGLDARVVSMSLGSTDAPKDEDNPEDVAINALVEKDIIPVIAAGNSGPSPSTVGSPGSCLNSLTVGAWDSINGKMADFSSRGPTAGDGYVKPDVIAPGYRIDSALVGYLDGMVDPTQPKYGAISGTSMSVPHDGGLVTCMAQLYEEVIGKRLTVHEVKRMMGEIGPNQPKDTVQGNGFIDWGIVERWVETTYGVRI